MESDRPPVGANCEAVPGTITRRFRRLHLVAVVVLVVLGASGASAQDCGVLAIGVESARHAFSFSGEADAVNMCGTADCEVVATFSSCMGVAHSRYTARGEPVWTWTKASTEDDARQGAQEECEAADGLACSVLNVVCLADTGSGSASAAAPPASAEQETVFWQSIVESTNPAMFEAYLAQFPNGVFRALAEARLAELRASPDQRSGAPRSPASGASAVAGTDAAVTLPNPASGIPVDQVCTPKSDGVSCWMEVSDRPGCYVWNPNPHPGETVTWTAVCANGFAQGTGTLTWLFAGRQQTGNGRLRDGKTDGTWHFVDRSADGSLIEESTAEFSQGRRAR